MWPAPCLILSKIAPASILFLLIILLLLQHATLVNPKHITRLEILPSEINKYIGGQLHLFLIKIRNNDLTSDIRCHTDMRFVKKITLSYFQAKKFTL